MAIKTMRCGWAGSLNGFLSTELISWGKTLVTFHAGAAQTLSKFFGIVF